MICLATYHQTNFAFSITNNRDSQLEPHIIYKLECACTAFNEYSVIVLLHFCKKKKKLLLLCGVSVVFVSSVSLVHVVHPIHCLMTKFFSIVSERFVVIQIPANGQNCDES